MTIQAEKQQPAMLWTPWGGQRILQPGERFAALRVIAKRLRAARKTRPALGKPQAT
jgi:hypothetical protein